MLPSRKRWKFNGPEKRPEVSGLKRKPYRLIMYPALKKIRNLATPFRPLLRPSRDLHTDAPYRIFAVAQVGSLVRVAPPNDPNEMRLNPRYYATENDNNRKNPLCPYTTPIRLASIEGDKEEDVAAYFFLLRRINKSLCFVIINFGSRKRIPFRSEFN